MRGDLAILMAAQARARRRRGRGSGRLHWVVRHGLSPDDCGMSLSYPGASLRDIDLSLFRYHVSPPEPDISPRDLGASLCEPGRSLRDLDPRARDPGVPPRDPESPSSGPGLPSFELDVPSSEPGVPGFDPDSPSSDPGVPLRVPGTPGCVAGTPSPKPRCSFSHPAGEDAGGGSGEACDDRLLNVQVGAAPHPRPQRELSRKRER